MYMNEAQRTRKRMQATDVDSVTHIKGKFYLFNEANVKEQT